MSFPNPVRLIAVLLLPFGLAACGADGADLIPVGLRTTLAAEDHAKQQVVNNPISVDEMLARARKGEGAAPTTTPPGSGTTPSVTAIQGSAPERSGPEDGSPSPPLPVLMSAQVKGDMPTMPAAPAANGVHPLWAQMVDARASSAHAPTAMAPEGQPTFVAATHPSKPAPIDPSTVVLKFSGNASELKPEEKARLDAAVTMRKTSAKAGARIVAGPAGEGEPFQRLVLSDRRLQAVDSALPADMERSRIYSPEIDIDTVRVEFPAAKLN